MPDQPLQPFTGPSAILSHLPVWVSAALFVEIFLCFVFAFWLVYTLVATYHWFKYSNASWVMFPAVAAHVCISLALMAYALTGHGSFLSPYLPS